MADYDYNSYIQELVADGAPLDRAEYTVGEAVCEYMNNLAENAYKLYEKAVEERCELEDKAYCPINRETTPQLPLELFTKNIKTNKLDFAKWNVTIQDHLLQHMPSDSSTTDPDKGKEILNRLSNADRTIYSAFPLKQDVPGGRLLFAPLIPVAFWVGQAITAAIVAGIGVGIGVVVHNRRRQREEWSSPAPSAPPSGTAPSSGGTPAPPTPSSPATPDTMENQLKKRDERDKRRRRQRGKESKRKARKDYYFGYVDRIEPSGSGFEIRVEALEENSLSDEVFIRELQKLALAAGIPSFGRYRFTILSIYVRSVPPNVEVGEWINFKVNAENKTPATPEGPDVSSPTFVDGVTLMEPLEPTLSFLNFRIECYFSNNDGYIVQTEVESITGDITANTLGVLKSAFGTFDMIAETIKSLLPLFMNPTPDHPPDTVSANGDNRVLAKDNRPKAVLDEEDSERAIKKALFAQGNEVSQYNLYNVGQGHSGRAFNSQGQPMFANDFGYGKTPQKSTVCIFMIYKQRKVPILLSHWDLDHFRIAWSPMAKMFKGLPDDVTKRTWVAPGAGHIVGPATNMLAWNIKSSGTLLQWPKTTAPKLQAGNVTIISCQRNTQYKFPDKNNHGALALVLGSGKELLVYPGDANYESIPGIGSLEAKVRVMIATHHGSTVALKSSDGSGLGGSIPRASPGASYTVFSYAKGNTYGHDVKNSFPLYEKAGYTKCDATETFKPGEDTFTMNVPGATRLLADAPSTTSLREIVPGLIQADSIPAQPSIDSLMATAVSEASTTPASSSESKAFPDLLTLTGSGGATPTPGQDDLSAYAIRDEFGDIVIYDIITTKLVLDRLPLVVPCTTDYPVTVQITCHDLEIHNSAPLADGLIPLIRFEVANGFDWAHQADVGKSGEPGNQAFAGGRIRLAVAGSWTRTGTGGTASMSGLSLQYRGGRGGNGQKGGVGVAGKDGVNGGVVTTIAASGVQPIRSFTTGPVPENGGDGFKGGDGGDAGAPGTIANSEVLATVGKWPSGWKVVISLGTPGTDNEYGKAGLAGQGGQGGTGGKGSTYWFQPTVVRVGPGAKPPTQPPRQQRGMPGGKTGKNGAEGKVYDTSMAQFRQATVNVKMVATEDEMLELMAPVDWRFDAE